MGASPRRWASWSSTIRRRSAASPRQAMAIRPWLSSKRRARSAPESGSSAFVGEAEVMGAGQPGRQQLDADEEHAARDAGDRAVPHQRGQFVQAWIIDGHGQAAAADL